MRRTTMSTDRYTSPLSERYASKEMQYIFSPEMKFRTWRRLWIALAETEKELGLDITQEQIDELKAHKDDINFEVAKEREKLVRHDVMSHVYAYGVQCPKAKGIIHLGATSCYVGDNTDIILMSEALKLVRKKLVNVIAELAKFADRYKELPTLAFTHFQPAQPTTVGKRATLWTQEFLMDLEDLDYVLDSLKLLGSKGTTGTQASFLELFEGDQETIDKIDPMIAAKMGFKDCYPVSGQTYSRKVDTRVLNVLAGIAASAHKFSNDIRLLQYPFISPISSSDAISFYKFYIMDTTFVDKDKCFHLTFVPNNSQDFGFTGHLYVLADSSYTVKKCTMNLPKKSGVNFVDNMDIIQEFEQLPNGEWVLKTDDMIVEMTLMKIMQGFQIRRTTRYSDYAFDELPQQLFKRKGAEIKEADAMMRGDDFWNQYRPVPLTQTESSMDMLVKRLEQMPGFKYVIFVLKAFIENFVETGTKEHPSKVDIGPVNTMISNNYIDGLRLRMSAQTTANLNPHLFFKGYYAYGFKDHRSKYMGEVEYSFNKKEYLPREFPKNSITFSYQYDVMSPTDKFLKTDKDNVFVSFKTSTVDQMSYVRNIALKYENETQFGLKTTVEVKHSTDEPTGGLAYITNDDQKTLVPEIQTMEASLAFRYAPGETFVNTKQRRIPVSFDAPVFTLSHTAGFKGVLGGEYNYNLTEIGLYKRFWFSSWGKIDMFVKGGAQWNKVPFPLLIMPAANLSYILQRETFNLINNMEFLNDRYASLDVSWDLNGKIFNRIPLLKKLKWREAIGFKMLYGHLTDKNNPMKHPGDSELFLFPTRDGRPTSFVMDPKTPYMECSVGIHNIFKILHIDYVRRLNYLDHPDANKWGVRFMVMMTF